MESLGISHQTLREFIEQPFGVPNKEKQIKYESRYQNFKKQNKIKIESSIEFEKNYFIHLKVPSESQKGDLYYDVVVQFFTSNEKISKQLTIENYYVQFFSNSPGFVYKYAALYKLKGYLIESLCDKYDNSTLNTLPEKSNSSFELYYDSTIYYACRYLLDNKISSLGKLNIKIFKTKPVKSFFEDIRDFEETNITRDTNKLISNIKKEISRDTKLSEQQENKLKKNGLFTKELWGRKKKKKSTFDESNVKTRSNPTMKKHAKNKISPKSKKNARNTTRKG